MIAQLKDTKFYSHIAYQCRQQVVTSRSSRSMLKVTVDYADPYFMDECRLHARRKGRP